MRQIANVTLLVLLLAAAIATACAVIPDARPETAPPAAAAVEAPPVDFASQVLPIVRRCEPCHFEGGKMYAELPFDDPATLRHLGEALFTRIQGADDQAVLRAFFAAPEP